MTQPEQTSTLFDTVKNYLTQDGWTFMPVEGETALQMIFKGSHSQWACFAQVREDLQQVIFYSVSPVSVPEEKMTAMAEFITRANYGLIIGNFEMDFEDGELRYKTSLDVENVPFTPDLMRPIIVANVTTMDHYLPGALGIIYGNVTAEAAIAQIEVE